MLEFHALSFIEWQANAITPRISLPSLMLNKAMIKIVYNLNCKKYRSYLVDSVNDIITKLANNFNISKLSTKIRLIECGVMATNSAFVYIDDHYIKPYSFKAGSLKDFETFSISNSELYSMCNRNSTIKKLISSGRIKYTNSLLCANDSKYIKRSCIGKYILTEFAKLNVDECCIKFDKELVKSKSYSINNNIVLNRNSNGYLKYKLIMNIETNKNQILNSSMIDSN